MNNEIIVIDAMDDYNAYSGYLLLSLYRELTWNIMINKYL